MTAVQIAIEKLLIGTGRDGIQNLIDYMERSGFFSQRKEGWQNIP